MPSWFQVEESRARSHPLFIQMERLLFLVHALSDISNKLEQLKRTVLVTSTTFGEGSDLTAVCQSRNLNDDAMDHGRWKKLINIGWWLGWWVGECFFCYRLTRVVPDKGPWNGCCCCCCVVCLSVFVRMTQKVVGGSSLNLGRLWTREKFVKFWMWFGTYSGYCGYRKFTIRSTIHNESVSYKISSDAPTCTWVF